MSPPRDYRPESMATGLVVGCALAVMLILGGLFVVMAPTGLLTWSDHQRAQYKSGVEFPPLDIDADQLQKARREFTGDPSLEAVDDEVDQLVSTYREINRRQFDDYEGTDTPTEDLETILTHRATEVETITGPHGFQVVGEEVFQRCRDGLQNLLEAVRAGELEMARAVANPPADQFEQYRANCGNQLRDLLQHYSLLDSDGSWRHPDGPVLVDLLQRYRWVQILQGQYYPNHRLMSPRELQIIYRWRIENAEAFSPDRRRQFLADGKGFLPEDYDVPLAKARIDAAAADSDEEVRQRFAELVEEYPDNDLYRAIYEDL